MRSLIRKRVNECRIEANNNKTSNANITALIWFKTTRCNAISQLFCYTIQSLSRFFRCCCVVTIRMLHSREIQLQNKWVYKNVEQNRLMRMQKRQTHDRQKEKCGTKLNPVPQSILVLFSFFLCFCL